MNIDRDRGSTGEVDQIAFFFAQYSQSRDRPQKTFDRCILSVDIAVVLVAKMNSVGKVL
jgi:hypothetical protein